MKKIAVYLLAVIVTLNVSGCAGGNSPDGHDTGNRQNGKVKHSLPAVMY